jgi:helix-turn-helix protein
MSEIPPSAPPTPELSEVKQPEISIASIKLVRTVSDSHENKIDCSDHKSIISHTLALTRELSNLKEFVLLSPEEQIASIHSVLKEKIDNSRLDNIVTDEVENKILDLLIHSIIPVILEYVLGKQTALICETTCSSILSFFRNLCRSRSVQ